MNPIKISKKLSFLLRHRPEAFQLTLDKNGWCSIPALLQAFQSKNIPLTLDLLEKVVAVDDKQRFAFNDTKTKIRANQGHSIPIDLALKNKIPPPLLYHGTAARNLTSIFEKGLLKGNRHHVHLSENIETAQKVGARYGKPVVLTINAAAMNDKGIDFYQSKNGVWLTKFVPYNFILK